MTVIYIYVAIEILIRPTSIFEALPLLFIHPLLPTSREPTPPLERIFIEFRATCTAPIQSRVRYFVDKLHSTN